MSDQTKGGAPGSAKGQGQNGRGQDQGNRQGQQGGKKPQGGQQPQGQGSKKPNPAGGGNGGNGGNNGRSAAPAPGGSNPPNPPFSCDAIEYIKRLGVQGSEEHKALGDVIAKQHTDTREAIAKSSGETCATITAASDANLKAMTAGFNGIGAQITYAHQANVTLHDRTYRKLQIPWFAWVIGLIIGIIGWFVIHAIIPVSPVLDQAGVQVGTTTAPYAAFMPWGVAIALFIATVALVGAVGKLPDSPKKDDQKPAKAK